MAVQLLQAIPRQRESRIMTHHRALGLVHALIFFVFYRPLGRLLHSIFGPALAQPFEIRDVFELN